MPETFKCPLVPLTPILGILSNIYLMANLTAVRTTQGSTSLCWRLTSVRVCVRVWCRQLGGGCSGGWPSGCASTWATASGTRVWPSDKTNTTRSELGLSCKQRPSIWTSPNFIGFEGAVPPWTLTSDTGAAVLLARWRWLQLLG